MKLALIFLSIFVAISHQQYFHPRMLFGFPWMSPFAQQPVAVNDYNDEVYPGLLGLNSRHGNDQDDEFHDIQSGIKGFSGNFNGLSRYRPSPSLNDQQNARFFFNLANTGNNANNLLNNFNPFFKTATFTLTSTLTLASIQSCVPATQVVAAPVACRRKRNEFEFPEEEDLLLSIAPSETLRMAPTALPTVQYPISPESHDLVSSTLNDEMSTADNLRNKRFFFSNKNLFIVSSTITSYSFVSTTIAVTVNLLNPAPVDPNVCADPNAGGIVAPTTPQCVACLPAGFIVCPVTG